MKHNGLIQPITVRPVEKGAFEIIAGARRFRAAQLAEMFSLPARIVDVDDTQALEWQLVENSQRVDVHPYEEAQGFQRLLDLPGYDVAALVEKSGKSASHVYARLSLLQLLPAVAEAFSEERITASHAALIARLPQEKQEAAFEQCWRKDWQDKEPHLLPSKHLAAWITATLYLPLAEAPFDREDTTLNSAAGACVTCPRRSGFNTALFADVKDDQCLDASCYHSKVEAHIERELAARPGLVQIEMGYRQPKEQRKGAIVRGQFHELPEPANLDAEPDCTTTRTGLIVYGKGVGTTLTVCTDRDCPVHDPRQAHRRTQSAAALPEHLQEPEEEETDEERQQRMQQREAYRQEQERMLEERRLEQERQQQEYEAEVERRDELRKARLATLARLVDTAPASLSASQLRVLLRGIVNLDPYSFADDLTAEMGESDDDRNAEEVLLSALDGTADEKLTGFAIRLALSSHVDVPRDGEPDFLTEAEAAFAAPPAPGKKTPARTKKPTLVTPAKRVAKRKAA